MRNLSVCLAGLALVLLAGCSLSISVVEPWHIEVKPQALSATATPTSTGVPSVAPPQDPQPPSPTRAPITRFLALQGSMSISPTTVITTYLLPIEQSPPPLMDGFSGFTPLGNIKAALAHPVTTQFATLGAETVGPWVLFTPLDSDLEIQSWAQVVVTTAISSGVTTTHYAIERPVNEVVAIPTEQAAQKDALMQKADQWGVSSSTEFLWIDFVLVEELQADGKPGLTLYRFALLGENPAPGDEQAAYCAQVCNRDTVTGLLICWWNRC